MKLPSRHWLWVGLCTLASVIGAEGSTQDKKAKGKSEGPKPIKLTLAPTKFKKGSLRMGYGLQQEPPTEGWQAKSKDPNETYNFFDLNGDGKLEPGADGFGIAAYPFVVSLPEKVLIKHGQCSVTFDETKSVSFTPEELGSLQRLAVEAAVFTEMRIRAGLRPVPIDLELSQACDKHLEYLKLNGLADGRTGDPHKEDLGRPGYSEEGGKAARLSNLSFGDEPVPQAIFNWYASAWHGPAMLKPKLTAFGIAKKYGVCAMHVGTTEGDQETIFVHPADGALGIPRVFDNVGELPNPVPGTNNGKGCGFPILIRLVPPYHDLLSAEVLDGRGGKVKGTFSSPSKPANPEWPSNSKCALFIPAQPLAPNTTYRVTFQFSEEKEPVRWSFTTGP